MENPITQAIAAKFAILSPLLDERARRLWAAVEARAIGRGGISQVAEATKLSRVTIRAGLQELARPVSAPDSQATPERLRRPGGGRKPLGAHDPHLVCALETLLDPVTRGDPMSLLRWTCKSAAKLAAALQTQGHGVSERTVNRLLHDLGYSLQGITSKIRG
jgi:Rhodopirellula transposase DDE domain